jgi:hypothetical protein
MLSDLVNGEVKGAVTFPSGELQNRLNFDQLLKAGMRLMMMQVPSWQQNVLITW